MQISRRKTDAYRAALKEEWDRMVKCYNDNEDETLFPISLKADTALHMAVYSQKSKPLQELLEIAEEYSPLDEHSNGGLNASILTNFYGNTPLHEAVITGNFEAVKLLATCCPSLLHVKNSFGETPLFLSASFADTKIVDYLANLGGQLMVDHEPNTPGLQEIHRQKNDGSSILQSALKGECFETALFLLKLDKSLADLKDGMEKTALHSLSNMPSAFRSGYSMGIIKKLFYSCLPIEDTDDDEHNVKQDNRVHSRQVEDLESGCWRNQSSLCKGWPLLENIWNDKKKHEQALRFAKLLIKNDFSWNTIDESGYSKSEQAREGRGQDSKQETPLFIATRTGIVEIVEETLEEHPQAIEHLNDAGQNILQLAVLYRREKIFNLVQKMRIPFTRLCQKTDNKGYTLLHQVADMTHYTGGTKPGPALQLQEELIWFERVKKAIPTPYAAFSERQQNKTAAELFTETHGKQLKEAQKWIKETSQSCSTVAVLVATVVFAAAYTVPGGSNAEGIPNFLHNTFFKFFTIMDVVSLACSLTSVVMFLSTLTSPFELKDFYQTLPRRLMLGFTMLFLSLVTTMLAFGATILLIIRLEKKLTTSLISIAAFLPVLVFVLLQIDLYVAFLDGLKDFLEETMKALPVCCMPSFWGKKKLN